MAFDVSSSIAFPVFKEVTWEFMFFEESLREIRLEVVAWLK